MIPVPSAVRVWVASGHTDMRRGMNGLSLIVQQGLGRDLFAGDLYVFRGRRGDLVKCLWHDGLGLSLYAKRLERGRFVWPATAGEPDDLLRDYAHALVIAQLDRTRRAWARVRRAWDRYFGALMTSEAAAHPDHKATLAERTRRHVDRDAPPRSDEDLTP